MHWAKGPLFQSQFHRSGFFFRRLSSRVCGLRPLIDSAGSTGLFEGGGTFFLEMKRANLRMSFIFSKFLSRRDIFGLGYLRVFIFI